VEVIEQRRVGRESLLAHEFLGVKAAVVPPELSVAFPGNLPGHPVIRHIVPLDVMIRDRA